MPVLSHRCGREFRDVSKLSYADCPDLGVINLTQILLTNYEANVPKAKYDHLVCHHTLPWLISISLDNFAYAQGQYNKDGRAHIVLTERKIQRCGQSAILARRVRISQEERSMRWTCKACRYVKHFTKAVPLEAAGKCPRCKSTEFKPIL